MASKSGTGWSKAQAREFAKRAKKRAGDGWTLLGPELREALVCQEVLLVVVGQHMETVRVSDVETLIQDAMTAAGLIVNPGDDSRPANQPGDDVLVRILTGESSCPTCGGTSVRRPFQACPNDDFHGGK